MESHEESWNTIPHVILTALTKASFEEKKMTLYQKQYFHFLLTLLSIIQRNSKIIDAF